MSTVLRRTRRTPGWEWIARGLIAGLLLTVAACNKSQPPPENPPPGNIEVARAPDDLKNPCPGNGSEVGGGVAKRVPIANDGAPAENEKSVKDNGRGGDKNDADAPADAKSQPQGESKEPLGGQPALGLEKPTQSFTPPILSRIPAGPNPANLQSINGREAAESKPDVTARFHAPGMKGRSGATRDKLLRNAGG